VAHELNNPITAIIGNVQLMQREITPDKEQLESLELIEQAGRRAQKVVGDLLNFARQESQKFVIVDVNNSIQQALALIQLQWPKSDVHLEILLDDDIPQVHGNPDHLQSVWLNLLLNARDALEDKKGKVTIQSFRSDDQVTVQVSDNGIGISAENLQKVFEPFFTTKAPGRGTGLGLPTSYRIIKQHSGTIQVESVLKRGTTVTVKLPAASVSLS
jgi:two-component system NtrC family sensor kinase